MSHRSRFLPRVAGALLLLSTAVLPAATPRPPRAWPAEPFQPLTRERIAQLPAAEQAPWLAYWTASEKLLDKLPRRPAADASSLRFLPGPPKGGIHSKGLRLEADAGWYSGEEAATIADRVVAWQSGAGAWKKGIDYTVPPAAGVDAGTVWISGTFDNNATLAELRFLARAISAARDAPRASAWRAAFVRGLGYVHAAQYPNGGFPQVYPLVGGYHDGVTFNDNAMTQALELLRDVASGEGDYAFVAAELRREAATRFARGLRCVLATQQRDAAGRPTAWAQQYDPLTLRPAAARNFEPIGDAAQESAALALLLMSVRDPSAEIVAAVEGAIAWFRRTALRDLTWVRLPAESRAELVSVPGAPLLWSRLYESGTTTPIFGDRDRTIHYDVTEVSPERRAGYAWYGTWPAAALHEYETWKTRR